MSVDTVKYYSMQLLFLLLMMVLSVFFANSIDHILLTITFILSIYYFDNIAIFTLCIASILCDVSIGRCVGVSFVQILIALTMTNNKIAISKINIFKKCYYFLLLMMISEIICCMYNACNNIPFGIYAHFEKMLRSISIAYCLLFIVEFLTKKRRTEYCDVT